MPNLYTALGSALYSHLAAGTALTTALGGTAIYNRLAPDDASLPYVVFFPSSDRDENTSPRRAQDWIYTVKAVAVDTSGVSGQLLAEQLADHIDALIHEQEITITDWGNYWSARTTGIEYTEPGAGAMYWHCGGQYRVRIAE